MYRALNSACPRLHQAAVTSPGPIYVTRSAGQAGGPFRAGRGAHQHGAGSVDENPLPRALVDAPELASPRDEVLVVDHLRTRRSPATRSESVAHHCTSPCLHPHNFRRNRCARERSSGACPSCLTSSATGSCGGTAQRVTARRGEVAEGRSPTRCRAPDRCRSLQTRDCPSCARRSSHQQLRTRSGCGAGLVDKGKGMPSSQGHALVCFATHDNRGGQSLQVLQGLWPMGVSGHLMRVKHLHTGGERREACTNMNSESAPSGSAGS